MSHSCYRCCEQFCRAANATQTTRVLQFFRQMTESIKARLKSLVLLVDKWPLIGRFVRIGVAILRLPEFCRRQSAFESEQLPRLLQTISNLNHRQLASDSAKDNLVLSVPVALRTISRDLAAVRRQAERDSSIIDLLMGRIEFIRRELMFEMQYGTSSRSTDREGLKAKSRILSPEKLAAARSEQIRLNLGCGHLLLKGYLNVDRRELPGVDIVGEVDELPISRGEVAEIYSAHLLEYFPQEQLRRQILPYLFSLLKAGGEFRAVVSDAEAMIREYSSGRYRYEDLRAVMFGGQEYQGDFHFNMFIPESLEGLLTEAGFVSPSVTERGSKDGLCREFEITAKKPSQSSDAS